MDYSLPGSSVLGIFQARILEWVAISSSRGLPDPGTEPMSPASPALEADSLPAEPWGGNSTLQLRLITPQVLEGHMWI